MGITRRYQRHFLRIEGILAVLLPIALSVWGEYFDGARVIEPVMLAQRGSLYPALAQIFASLLGFVITAQAIILGFTSSPRMRVLRSSDKYPEIWKVFGQGTLALGMATIVALAAIVVDQGQSLNRPVFYLGVMATLFAALRLARCVWVLQNIVAIVAGSPVPLQQNYAPPAGASERSEST